MLTNLQGSRMSIFFFIIFYSTPFAEGLRVGLIAKIRIRERNGAVRVEMY